jgi:hypothetical protein
VSDRLYQGPFSADDYPSWSGVMALTASRNVVPNYGMRLIIGFVNDGIAGVLRVSIVSEDGKVNAGGSLDAGCPLPGKVRQAKFPLPKGTKWQGLRLKAAVEVKGQPYPMRWACGQSWRRAGCAGVRRVSFYALRDVDWRAVRRSRQSPRSPEQLRRVQRGVGG